jgi:hypothetical protein
MSAACPIFGFDEVMKLHAYLAKQFQTHQRRNTRAAWTLVGNRLWDRVI